MFSVSILFLAILIAQFDQSFDELTEKARVNVIVKKTEIMQNMDELFMCFPCCHKCVSSSPSLPALHALFLNDSRKCI